MFRFPDCFAFGARLLLTNDTALEAMTNPEYKLPKTYLVKASPLLSDE